MGTIGQGHEGEKRPVIVRGRVGAILAAKPALDLRASGGSSVGPPICSMLRPTSDLAWWKPTTHTRGGNSGTTVISLYPTVGGGAAIHLRPLSKGGDGVWCHVPHGSSYSTSTVRVHPLPGRGRGGLTATYPHAMMQITCRLLFSHWTSSME